MLTAHIQRTIPALERQEYTNTRNKHIAVAADTFTVTFRLYANQQYTESSRLRHLTNVLQEAADLGVWLFSQPCEFEFVWTAAEEGKFAVFPAMVKTYDEDGRRLAVKQDMVHAVTAAL